MKRILCLVALLGIVALTRSAPATIAAQSLITPPLVTASQRALWDRLRTENHEYYQHTCREGAKDGTPDERYTSRGRWSALCYQMGGDPAMAARAYAALQRASANFTNDMGVGNLLREHATETVVTLTWIAPALTAEQITAAKPWLIKNADAATKSIRLNDSDQVTGTLMFLLTMDRAFGTSYAIVPLVVQMREAFRGFAAKSAGGGWVEFGDYDWGTLYLALNGAEAAGIEQFPEIVALRSELARAIPQWFTPDLKDTLELGDDQTPNRVPFHAVEDLLAILGHHSAVIRGFEAELRQIRQLPFGSPTYARYFAWADPFGTRDTLWRAAVGTWLVNPGLGKVYAKTGWTPADCGFVAWFPPFSNGLGGIDHVYPWFGHFRLYCDGRYQRDSPIAYSLNVQLANHTVLAGLPASKEVGVMAGAKVGRIVYVSGTNAGLDTNTDAYIPPATFRHELSPSVFYIPSWRVVVKVERIHVDDPKTQMLSATATSWSRFSAAQQTAITSNPLIRSIWHSQTTPPVVENGVIVGDDRVTPLYAATITVVDMARVIAQAVAANPSARPYGTLDTKEARWFVTVDPLDQSPGFRVLTTITGEATGTVEQLGDVQRLRLSKAGERDIVIYSSTKPGPTLKTSTELNQGRRAVYDRTKVDGILAARTVTIDEAWQDASADVFVEQANHLVQLAPPPSAPASPARELLRQIRDLLDQLGGLVP